MGYIFILYTTFRFNIQGYPFRYHFFTSSAYFKMPGEKVRHIIVCKSKDDVAPAKKLAEEQGGVIESTYTIMPGFVYVSSSLLPRLQLLTKLPVSTCLPIPSALSQTAHTSSLPNWTERSPPNRALYRYIYRFICHAIREDFIADQHC